MCLSTVYKNRKTPENILLRSVARIRWADGAWVFTDLMDREVAVEGSLEEADLLGGFVLIRENGKE